jgi:hypothetical protein
MVVKITMEIGIGEITKINKIIIKRIIIMIILNKGMEVQALIQISAQIILIMEGIIIIQ